MSNIFNNDTLNDMANMGFDSKVFEVAMMNKFLVDSCLCNNLAQVKAYLELPENPTKEDQDVFNKMSVYHNNCKAFKSAVDFNALEVVHYLIFDYRIEETKEIQKFLILKEYDHIQKMFLDRDNYLVSEIPDRHTIKNPGIIKNF